MTTEPGYQPLAQSDADRDRKAKWYNEKIGEQLSPTARELLQNYSKIPSDEIESHVYTIDFWLRNSTTLLRDKAWDIFPYPCIGQFRFLDFAISKSTYWPTILSRLKTGEQKYLDIGCCFGQDIRELVYEGVPGKNIYGCDIETKFFDCGFELFRDRATLKATFFQADIFDPHSELSQLDGKIDIIYIGSFLHLFGYSQQVEACVRIAELLKDKEGSMVLGRQIGDEKPGEYAHGTEMKIGKTVMRHNVESFKKMWEEVGALTGSKWRVEAELSEPIVLGNLPPMEKLEGIEASVTAAVGMTTRRITFAVFREAVDEE